MTRSFYNALLIATFLAMGCGRTDSQPSPTDVTADYLRKAGSQTYSVGTTKVDSGASEVSVSNDGTLKIKYNDTQCPFVVSGTLTKVTKDADGQHYEFNYTLSNVQLLPDGADNKDCQKFISDYTFNHIPEKITKIACGYTAEYVDFGCNGDKNNFANWILKH